MVQHIGLLSPPQVSTVTAAAAAAVAEDSKVDAADADSATATATAKNASINASKHAATAATAGNIEHAHAHVYSEDYVPSPQDIIAFKVMTSEALRRKQSVDTLILLHTLGARSASNLDGAGGGVNHIFPPSPPKPLVQAQYSDVIRAAMSAMMNIKRMGKRVVCVYPAGAHVPLLSHRCSGWVSVLYVYIALILRGGRTSFHADVRNSGMMMMSSAYTTHTQRFIEPSYLHE